MNSSPKSSASKTWRISISDSLAVGLGQRFDPLDRLFLRLHLKIQKPAIELLGLGERAVDDGPLAARN